MKFVNLTPHTVNETLTARVFPPSGTIARVSAVSTPEGELGGIPVFNTVYGAVEGLPAPQDGVALIVSAMVKDAAKGSRFDLVSPGDLVRDAAGVVIGCKGFKI
jgi:hypothetical protein